ncbi:MAG: hypothetical protein V3U89_07910 [Methylophilaceae bacterium]
MTWYWWLAIVLGIVLLMAALLAKRMWLTLKYKDEDLVDELLNETFWQGQTAEQLRDSLGEPLDIDQKVLKTKVKEVWKYEQAGKNRYALKITLDDGVVVGWDQK